MSFKYSKASLARLNTCAQPLQSLFREVIKVTDCTILEGHRNQECQDAAFAEGRSKLKWPNGKHNTYPSHAIDAAPWPIDWEDRDRFHLFGGLVLGVAHGLAVPLRWGGDWDGDFQTSDNSFDDLVHFELKE
ncbi:MAG: M15 family peptidase [Pseudomonadota bacterium]